MRTDLRTGVDRSAIHPDSGTAWRTVGRDLAGVGAEPSGRILGRDAALQRYAAELDLVLTEAELGQALPRCNTDLRLHDVDIRHLFGHSVLDLNAWVHFDEDVLSCTLTNGVEQEFDGAGIDVANRPGESDRIRVEPLAYLVAQVRRWGDLEDFLVATLNRAVAFEEMHGLAGGIRQDLYLDVARTKHCRLEEHRRITEGAVRFAHGLVERSAQLRRVVDPAHAASAAARNRLRENRETDVVGLAD